MITVAANSAAWHPFSSIARLWDSLTVLQWAAVVSALVLTIGAVVEYRHQLRSLSVLIAKWLVQKATPFEVCTLKKLLIHSLGPILVVIGIAGDFIFEGRAFILENRQEAGAQRTIAALKKTASENEKEAEEIRESVAPRRLTANQVATFRSDLSKFSRQPVVAINNPFDFEAAVLAAEILSALKSADWDTNPNFGIDREVSSLVRAPSIPVTGVLVQSSPEKRSRRAAAELVTALSDVGFDSRMVTKGVVGFDPIRGKKERLVVIDVEARPEGPQGEAKLRAEAEKKMEPSSNHGSSP